jgi:hypothetical protein
MRKLFVTTARLRSSRCSCPRRSPATARAAAGRLRPRASKSRIAASPGSALRLVSRPEPSAWPATSIRWLQLLLPGVQGADAMQRPNDADELVCIQLRHAHERAVLGGVSFEWLGNEVRARSARRYFRLRIEGRQEVRSSARRCRILCERPIASEGTRLRRSPNSRRLRDYADRRSGNPSRNASHRTTYWAADSQPAERLGPVPDH